jgi:hypothetical protein
VTGAAQEAEPVDGIPVEVLAFQAGAMEEAEARVLIVELAFAAAFAVAEEARDAQPSGAAEAAAAPVFRWCGAAAPAQEQFAPGDAQDFAVLAVPGALFPALEWELVWAALPV